MHEDYRDSMLSQLCDQQVRFAPQAGKYKVCLEYHLGNCKGPCEGLQNAGDYHAQIDDIREIIKGNFKSSLHYFKHRMKAMAAEMQFEEAQAIKEKIEILENYQVKSTIVNPKINNVDVFSIISDETHAYVNFLQLSHGSIIRSHTLELKKKLDETDEELLQLAIIEIRQRFDSRSNELYLPFEVTVEPHLKVTVPKLGDKKKIVDLSERNAKFFRQERFKQIKIIDPDRHVNRIMAIDPEARAAVQRGHAHRQRPRPARIDDDRRRSLHDRGVDRDVALGIDLDRIEQRHPAADDAQVVAGGRAVERRGGRCAPVDDERLVVVVADAEAPDVADLALVLAVLLEVEAAEDEALVLVLEVRPAASGVVDQRVPLEEPGHLLVAHVAGAGRATAGHTVDGDEVGSAAGLGQLGVHAVQVLLLDGDLGSDGVDMGVGHDGVLLPSSLGRRRESSCRVGVSRTRSPGSSRPPSRGGEGREAPTAPWTGRS